MCERGEKTYHNGYFTLTVVSKLHVPLLTALISSLHVQNPAHQMATSLAKIELYETEQ